MDKCIWKRITWRYASLFLLLVPVFVFSYFRLPEDSLRGKHPIAKVLELWPVSGISNMQIFGYKLIFCLLIMGTHIFARRSRVCPEKFVPLGYLAFWGLTATAALYMGTWSRDIISISPPLHQRFLRLFDSIHRGGFWELSGYLILTSTSFRYTLPYIDEKREVARGYLQDVTMTNSEKILFVLGFVFILCGAFIESYGIIQSTG